MKAEGLESGRGSIRRYQNCCSMRSIISMESWQSIARSIATRWSSEKCSRHSVNTSRGRWIMSLAVNDVAVMQCVLHIRQGSNIFRGIVLQHDEIGLQSGGNP